MNQSVKSHYQKELDKNKQEVLNAIDIVCGNCFAMYDEDGNEVDGFCDCCPVRYYVAQNCYN